MTGVVPGLVSTIVPVYNRANLVLEAIESVLAQTYRPVEIILVDDGSTDDTAKVLESAAAKRPREITTVRQENLGPGLARERGRLLARGEFIQYLDSDDLLMPRKFETQVDALGRLRTVGIAYGPTREYRIGQARREAASFRTGESLERLFPDLLFGRIWQTVTPLFRRSVCDAIGPWTALRQEEDWEYDARVGALGTGLVWCDGFLADFRHHGGERAGGGARHDPSRMRDRARAHVLIYEHARRAGLEPGDAAMENYARRLFRLARHCGAMGLTSQSRELFELSRGASGPRRSRGRDFRLYRVMAAVLGWTAAGRLTSWAARDRTRPTSSPASASPSPAASEAAAPRR